MENSDPKTEQTQTTAAPDADGRIPNPVDCPRCRTPLVKKLFRTGSVQHPGKDMLVCPHCGNKH